MRKFSKIKISGKHTMLLIAFVVALKYSLIIFGAIAILFTIGVLYAGYKKLNNK